MADLMGDDATTPTASDEAPETAPDGVVTTLDAEQVARFHEVAAGRLGVDVETAGDLLTATDADGLLGQFERLSTIVSASQRRTPRADLSQGARGGTPVMGTPAEQFGRFLQSAAR